jgi:hypothetical protein
MQDGLCLMALVRYGEAFWVVREVRYRAHCIVGGIWSIFQAILLLAVYGH